MAKRGAVIDMGRHKLVQSSWRSMDSMAYSEQCEPETRPEFRVYETGMSGQCHAEYQARLEADAKRQAQMQALLDLKQRMLDKNLV